MTTLDDVTNFTRGANVTLLCDVIGDVTDDMRVTWWKDGDVVRDGDRSVTEDWRLRLYDVRTDDSGDYTCQAVRRLQQADDSVTITVHGQTSLLLSDPVQSSPHAQRAENFGRFKIFDLETGRQRL